MVGEQCHPLSPDGAARSRHDSDLDTCLYIDEDRNQSDVSIQSCDQSEYSEYDCSFGTDVRQAKCSSKSGVQKTKHSPIRNIDNELHDGPASSLSKLQSIVNNLLEKNAATSPNATSCPGADVSPRSKAYLPPDVTRVYNSTPKSAVHGSPIKPIVIRPQHTNSPAKSITARLQHVNSPAKSITARPQYVNSNSPAKSITARPQHVNSPAKSITARPQHTNSPAKSITARPQHVNSPAKSIPARPQHVNSPLKPVPGMPQNIGFASMFPTGMGFAPGMPNMPLSCPTMPGLHPMLPMMPSNVPGYPAFLPPFGFQPFGMSPVPLGASLPPASLASPIIPKVQVTLPHVHDVTPKSSHGDAPSHIHGNKSQVTNGNHYSSRSHIHDYTLPQDDDMPLDLSLSSKKCRLNVNVPETTSSVGAHTPGGSVVSAHQGLLQIHMPQASPVNPNHLHMPQSIKPSQANLNQIHLSMPKPSILPRTGVSAFRKIVSPSVIKPEVKCAVSADEESTDCIKGRVTSSIRPSSIAPFAPQTQSMAPLMPQMFPGQMHYGLPGIYPLKDSPHKPRKTESIRSALSPIVKVETPCKAEKPSPTSSPEGATYNLSRCMPPVMPHLSETVFPPHSGMPPFGMPPFGIGPLMFPGPMPFGLGVAPVTPHNESPQKHNADTSPNSKSSNSSPNSSYESNSAGEHNMSPTDDYSSQRGHKRKFHSASAVCVLSKWYDENLDHPYPDEATVEQLAVEGHITGSQVKKWMANKRVRSCNTLAFNGSIHPKKLQKLIQLKESNDNIEGTTSDIEPSTPFNVTSSPKSDKKSKRQLNPMAVEYMNNWYVEHLNYPYPTDDEKTTIAHDTCLTVPQVVCWFANKRNRSNNTRKISTKTMWQKLNRKMHFYDDMNMDSVPISMVPSVRLTMPSMNLQSVVPNSIS